MTKTRELADLGGGFTQSGTGAEQRTVEEKLKDVVSVKDFGAVGDGTTDDTSAIQAAIAAAITISATSPTTLVFPAGKYKITEPLEIVASGGERIEIVGGNGGLEAATIIVGYHGYGTGANQKGAFYIASGGSGYATEVSISGFLIERASSAFRSPPAIEAIGAAQSRFNNITVGSWSNTNFRFDTPQNVRALNLTSFSGGKSFEYKDASSITVTQSGTTLTASGNIFSSADVNKTVAIWGTGGSAYRRKAKITGYTSATQVTVDTSVTDATARNLYFGSPFASLTSASTTVTADASCFTAEDVGLQLWFRYPSGGHIHRAKITGYTSATEVTIDTAAPATNTACEFGCAGFEVYTSGDITGDSSDNKFINLQVESHKGIGVCIDDASVLEFVPAKIHSEQSVSSDNYSISAVWMKQADGLFSGSFDGQYVGAYKLWSSLQTAGFTFADLNSRTALDEKLFGIGPKNTDYDGAAIVFDNVVVYGGNATDTIKNVTDDQNTATPGYFITGTYLNRGNSSDYVLHGHLSQNAYVSDGGSAPTLFLEATNREYSLKSNGGSGSNRFTIRDESAASDRIYLYSSGAFGPGSDNTQSLGISSAKWSVVYAGTGTINTSDEREKQDIEALSDAELRVATALKGLVKKFRFKDAVQTKADDARIHVGVIAQEVIAAFQAEGLDPMRYGIVCYDQWDAELDDEGNEITPAGDRYGIRYEELLGFIIAAL